MSASIIEHLNKHFESRVRIGILSELTQTRWLNFSELKEKLVVSDGNLASHIKGLHSNRYIKLKRKFKAGKPQTSYCLTSKGEIAFQKHCENLINLIGNT